LKTVFATNADLAYVKTSTSFEPGAIKEATSTKKSVY